MRKLRGDTVKRYLEEYKDYPAKSLARIILEENKQLFEYSPDTSDDGRIDRVRAIIRYHIGQMGVSARSRNKDKRLFRERREPTPPPTIVHKPVPNRFFDVLILDIETAPIKAAVWGIWEQNVGLNQISKDWFMLSWAAKWLNGPTITSNRLTPEEVLKEDDKRCLCDLWHYLEEADIVIAHNADRFDIPKINARFLFYNIPPPMHYQTIDTLKVARGVFSLTSNKLDYLAKYLAVGEKIDTGGHELWTRCCLGEEAALCAMEQYNRHDVELLEKVYLKLRPYIRSHPNLAVLTDDNITICPHCGSESLKEEGYYNTQVGSYPAYRCYNCGARPRKRISSLTPEKRKSLLVSAAR